MVKSMLLYSAYLRTAFNLGLAFFAITVSYADIITRTYDLASYSADQDGATLSGSITIQFDSAAGNPGGVLPNGGDDFILLSVSAPITAWNFVVSKPGELSYQVSSTGPDADYYETSLALYTTPTSLSLAGGANLSIGIETLIPAEQTIVSWSRGAATDIYFSNFLGNASPRGWATLDPQNIALDSNGGWIIGTAVPEPGTATLLILGAGMTVFGIRRIRTKEADSNIE